MSHGPICSLPVARAIACVALRASGRDSSVTSNIASRVRRLIRFMCTGASRKCTGRTFERLRFISRRQPAIALIAAAHDSSCVRHASLMPCHASLRVRTSGLLHHPGRFGHAHRLQFVADLHVARHRRRQLVVHPAPRVNAVLRQPARRGSLPRGSTVRDAVRDRDERRTPTRATAGSARYASTTSSGTRSRNLRPRLEQLAVALLEILQPTLQHLRRFVLRIDGQQAVRVRERIAQQRPCLLGEPEHLPARSR